MSDYIFYQEAERNRILNQIKGLEFPPDWDGNKALQYIVRLISKDSVWDNGKQ